MENITSNEIPYDKCEIIKTLENEAIKHMGLERYEAFIRNVMLPSEQMENIQRNHIMRDFVSALEKECGIEISKKIFSGVCHGLKPSDFPWARERFLLYNDIDAFCDVILKENIEMFKRMYETNEKFYGQEINKDVLDFILQHPELLYGKREGNYIVTTAIPFNTKEYLNEKDPVKKRFHVCHCHFARDTILMEDGATSGTLCYCSLGHTRVYWEAVLDTPLEGEVEESVLNGGTLCRFRINIPEHIMNKYVKDN